MDGFLKPQLLELGFHGFGPDLVALFFRVESVGHDFLGEDALVVEEFVVEFEIVDGFAVIEAGDMLVDHFIEKARLVGWIDGAGEDAEEEDFGLGAAFFDKRDDLFDALGRFVRGLAVVAGVVGADHDDGELGILLVFEVPVLETPDDVFGPISGESKIEGVTVGVELFPGPFSGSFPALGD